jgi:hypothetical protein
MSTLTTIIKDDHTVVLRYIQDEANLGHRMFLRRRHKVPLLKSPDFIQVWHLTQIVDYWRSHSHYVGILQRA